MIAILILGHHWPLMIAVMARTCDMLARHPLND